jgi:hypothetical protein
MNGIIDQKMIMMRNVEKCLEDSSGAVANEGRPFRRNNTTGNQSDNDDYLNGLFYLGLIWNCFSIDFYLLLYLLVLLFDLIPLRSRYTKTFPYSCKCNIS